MYGISRFFVISMNSSAEKIERAVVINPSNGKTEKDNEIIMYISPL